jgi:hypothetical protein
MAWTYWSYQLFCLVEVLVKVPYGWILLLDEVSEIEFGISATTRSSFALKGFKDDRFLDTAVADFAPSVRIRSLGLIQEQLWVRFENRRITTCMGSHLTKPASWDEREIEQGRGKENFELLLRRCFSRPICE